LVHIITGGAVGVDDTELDSRQIIPLQDDGKRQGSMLKQHIEAELFSEPDDDLMWWRPLRRVIEKWHRLVNI